MSLINAMLSDLDARQASPPRPDGEPLSGLSPVQDVPSPPGSGLRLRLLFIGVLVLAIGAYALAGGTDAPAGRTDAPAGSLELGMRAAGTPSVPAGVGTGPWRARAQGASRDGAILDARADTRTHARADARALPAGGRGEMPASRSRGGPGLKLALRLPDFEAVGASEQAAAHSPPAPRGATLLSAMEVADRDEGTLIILRLSRQPEYVLYALEDPPRAVLELDDTALGGTLEVPKESNLISAVRSRRTDSGALLVIFDLADRARIEAPDVLAAGGRYELVLHLARLTGEATRTSAEAPRSAGEVGAPASSMKAKAATPPGVSAVRALYEEGARLLAGSRLVEGERRLREALALSPRHTPSRAYLVKHLLAQQRAGEAVGLLRAGLALDPHHAELAILLARARLESGELEAAIEVLQAARGEGSADPDLDAFLAALLQRAGRHEEAVTVYRSVVTRRPGNGVWWMGLAISLEAGRRRAEALAAYERAGRTPSLSDDLRRYVEERLVALRRLES